MSRSVPNLRSLVAVSAAVLLLSPVSPDRPGLAPAAAKDRATCNAKDGEVRIPAGAVLLGEDGPASAGEKVVVPAFGIDRHEVTNRQFAAFVQATGYRTEAEIQGEGAVFEKPERVMGLEDTSQWWRLVRGATWRTPQGPGSSIAGRMDDPVVQVTYADALAYAKWVGRDLPSEAQWERAARGHQTDARGQGSWAYADDGKPVANTWQGVFPVVNAVADGYEGLAPVGCFAANDFGVSDMIGNAWEWTTKVQGDPRVRVVKGGSFLCSFDYCANFRPAGWQAQEADFATSHIGFRTVSAVRPG